MSEETKREKFHRFINEWAGKMQLNFCEVTVHYYESAEFFQAFPDETPRTIARVTSDWRYINADIYVNLAKLETLTDEQIEGVAVHELVHVFLEEMHEDDMTHEERVTSLLTRAFLHLDQRWKQEIDP